jgi:hypothetical protein
MKREVWVDIPPTAVPGLIDWPRRYRALLDRAHAFVVALINDEVTLSQLDPAHAKLRTMHDMLLEIRDGLTAGILTPEPGPVPRRIVSEPRDTEGRPPDSVLFCRADGCGAGVVIGADGPRHMLVSLDESHPAVIEAHGIVPLESGDCRLCGWDIPASVEPGALAAVLAQHQLTDHGIES